jgi:hypothetical protein
VLGKHSGRHALGLRCEQLGHQFERQQLDEIYRRFVVLADQIKQVEDHHLLELIGANEQDGSAGEDGQLKPLPRAVAAGAGARSDRGREHSQLMLSIPPPTGPVLASLAMNPVAERHADQEDYLWGV